MTIFNQKTLSTLIAGTLVFGSSSVVAQDSEGAKEAMEKAMKETEVVEANGENQANAMAIPRYYTTRYCRLYSPSQVHRFELLCYGGTYLEVLARDASYPYDHWRVTAQANNAYESVAVTESLPGVPWWGAPARVYNGYNKPTYLKAAVACRYVADAFGYPHYSTGYAEVAFLSDASHCNLYDHGAQYDEPDAL